jgi:hypothetical protein
MNFLRSITLVPSIVFLVIVLLVSCECGETYDFDETADKELTSVASSKVQWNSVAVSTGGRMFVSFPNRSTAHGASVAEITDTTNLKNYPRDQWNTSDESVTPERRLIAVQSVFIDNMNFLWILDAANPERNGNPSGVIDGGAKLLKVDLATNNVVKTITFHLPYITASSVLSEVRIDERRQIAYITDSNDGALLIIDLENENMRRVLDGHPAMKSENIQLNVDGHAVTNEAGDFPVIHAKSLALTTDGGWLYWRSPTARTLYRINTEFLRDVSLDKHQLSEKVEKVDVKYLPPSDGMIIGPDGTLYIGSMEMHAVLGVRNNTFFRVKQNKELLHWPSSFSFSQGFMYALTSQPQPGDKRYPYRIFKFKVPLPNG